MTLCIPTRCVGAHLHLLSTEILPCEIPVAEANIRKKNRIEISCLRCMPRGIVDKCEDFIHPSLPGTRAAHDYDGVLWLLS